MKHKYFGDVNDYRKYGLLRVLQVKSGLKLAVWWMLTPNDERSDGRFTEYLQAPFKWRAFDPVLFDGIASTIQTKRHLDHVKNEGLLRDAILVEGEVPDDVRSRARYFESVQSAITESELVFFDPDNGFEIPSYRPGRPGSSKYVTWAEVLSVYASGKSVLVYQHFPRKPRDQFVRELLQELARRTSSTFVTCFQTANVGFFLAAHEAHAPRLARAAKSVDALWPNQIRLISSIV